MVPTLEEPTQLLYGKLNRSYPFFTREQQLVLIGIDTYPIYELIFLPTEPLPAEAKDSLNV